MDDRYHGPLPRSEADKELIEDIMRNVDAVMDSGSSYVDMMYAAYLRETDIPPDRVALVQNKDPETGRTVSYFMDRDALLDLMGYA